MFNIDSNNIIAMNRGDSGSFDISLNAKSTLNPIFITLGDHDSVYVGVMEPNMPFERSLIRKIYGKDDLNKDGTLTISFKPEDTEFLLPGLYYYEIKVEKVKHDDIAGYITDEVYTIISKRKFIIME